jgi:diguanylate cyclase (GGDEF)-like protein
MQELASLAVGQLELCRSLTGSPAALYDLQTGVYATPAFVAIGEQQIRLARRGRRRLALLSITLDLGMAAGDAAEDTVAEVAGLLKRTFRDSDLVARLAPRELVVLAVEVQPGSLEPMLSRTWEKLEGYNAGRERRVGVGVGVAMFDPDEPCSLRDLLAEAGQQLPTYAALV